MMFAKVVSYCLAVGFVLFSGLSQSATLHVIPSGASSASAFTVQLALDSGDSLSSFSVDLGLGSAANAPALGFQPGGSIGSAQDYNGAQGNLLPDGTTLRLLGDTFTPASGAVTLPSGPATLDLFKIDINRPSGSTSAVGFTLLDWELIKNDLATPLTITNQKGDVLATSTVPVPLPGALVLFIVPVLGLLSTRRRVRA